MKSAALERARTAAAAAGVEVRELRSLPEQEIARNLFDEIWPGEGTQITPNLLQAMVHNGAYLSGAFIDEQPIGAAFAFPGKDDEEIHLHSHMAAVTPVFRDRQIGLALKLHQRWWGLEEGYRFIRWTFDPLVRRNAVLNLRKLGVEVIAYHADFYGQMPDAINAGDHSDRLMVQWELSSERVERALSGGLTVADAPGQVSVGLPEDIVAIRKQDVSEALAWRMRVREELMWRLDQGWRLLGLDTEDRYVLEQR